MRSSHRERRGSNYLVGDGKQGSEAPPLIRAPNPGDTGRPERAAASAKPELTHPARLMDPGKREPDEEDAAVAGTEAPGEGEITETQQKASKPRAAHGRWQPTRRLPTPRHRAPPGERRCDPR